ncbi:MAG: outer membrane lipoprotein carrier protein LolA [Phycisphaerae bacterium]|nr:hypothetical protein [Tepidisphaeraceae bacterium]
MKPTPLLIAIALLVAAPTDAAPLAPDADLDAVLDALHKRGEGLKDFSADVKLTTSSDQDGSGATQAGKVVYQNRENAAARVRVSFATSTTINDAGKAGATVKRPLDYMLQDGWLTDRDYTKKLEVRRQVLRPGQRMNLLKLGEGPFPLPIGQPKEEVKKQFDVTKPAASADDPKNTIRLVLTPKAGTQFAKRIKTLDVWVDRDSHFPTRIDAAEKSQSTRSTELTNLKVNAGVADASFELPDIAKEGWNRREEPFE